MSYFKFLLLFCIVHLTGCNRPRFEFSASELRGIIPAGNRLTQEALFSFGSLLEYDLSPDGTTIVYSVGYSNAHRGQTFIDIYTIPLIGGDPTNITRSTFGEYMVKWRPDGKYITFLSYESGTVQLWQIPPEGGRRRKISNVEGGITGYLFSPCMQYLAFTKSVTTGKSVNDLHPDLPLANARIENDLFYRLQSGWVNNTSNHLFITRFRPGRKIRSGESVMLADGYTTPIPISSSICQIAWTPCGKKIAYSTLNLEGNSLATCLNSDIFLYELASGQTKNLTRKIPGMNLRPEFSPNGRLMLWESMALDGPEADKNRLMVKDLDSGDIIDHSKDFDYNIYFPSWDATANKIWFATSRHGSTQIYTLDLETRSISQITKGWHNLFGVIQANDFLLARRESISMSADLVRIDLKMGSILNLTNINAPQLSQFELGKVEKRWVTTTDNKQMLVWKIYPPCFNPSLQYPVILYCQGGPNTYLSHSWNSVFNFHKWAAKGYIVVVPSRRGIMGFGKEWQEQVIGDFGGQNKRDLLSAIDAVAIEPYVDETRMAAMGDSFGGFSVFWLAGNHEGRFSAFVSFFGIYNMDMMYKTTDIVFPMDRGLGGPYWEQPYNRYSFSPHLFIENWDTPILIIHGGLDFRVPESQGFAAFNAAQMRGIPSRLIYFPWEGHGVGCLHNNLFLDRELTVWLDKWLKP